MYMCIQIIECLIKILNNIYIAWPIYKLTTIKCFHLAYNFIYTSISKFNWIFVIFFYYVFLLCPGIDRLAVLYQFYTVVQVLTFNKCFIWYISLFLAPNIQLLCWKRSRLQWLRLHSWSIFKLRVWLKSSWSVHVCEQHRGSTVWYPY